MFGPISYNKDTFTTPKDLAIVPVITNTSKIFNRSFLRALGLFSDAIFTTLQLSLPYDMTADDGAIWIEVHHSKSKSVCCPISFAHPHFRSA